MSDQPPTPTSIHFDATYRLFIVTIRGRTAGAYATEKEAEASLLLRLKLLLGGAEDGGKVGDVS